MCLLDICPSMSHWLSQSFSPPVCALLCSSSLPGKHAHSVNVRKTHEKALLVCVFKEISNSFSLVRRDFRYHFDYIFIFCMSTATLLVYFHLYFASIQANLWPRNYTSASHPPDTRKQQAPAGRIWIYSEAYQ